MNRLTSILIALSLAGLTISGCDYSAKGDLRAAENALKEADKVHAAQWAEREYRKAEAALGEAMSHARNNEVNEARDKAAEAKSWASEATDLAIKRAAEMEAEKDRLGGYKP